MLDTLKSYLDAVKSAVLAAYHFTPQFVAAHPKTAILIWLASVAAALAV